MRSIISKGTARGNVPGSCLRHTANQALASVATGKLSSATRLLILVAGVLACSPVARGQQNGTQQDPFQHPFANPVDDPELPRVLIIGDSISIGYTPRVRKLLDGKANVHRVTTNCRWSAFGEEKIAEWVGDTKWDIIHFNFGLWDWYGWSQDIKATPESYAKSLDSIVVQLEKSDARLIFALTTPPCVGPERKVKVIITGERAQEFNNAAVAVMKKHGVQINDLYAVIGKDRAKYQRGENDVHYNEEGRDLLAAQVAETIGTALQKQAREKDVDCVHFEVEQTHRTTVLKTVAPHGDKAGIYDPDWYKLEEIPVTLSNAEVSTVRSDLSMKATLKQTIRGWDASSSSGTNRSIGSLENESRLPRSSIGEPPAS